MAKEARNSKKCSTKLRVSIPTVQCKLNVNAKYLLNEYVLKSESKTQKIKEKGRKKKKQTEKSTYPQIFQFIKIYKNIRGN